MNEKAVIQIIGAPIACATGTEDGWREVAGWTAGQMEGLFGEAVRVVYYDLFDEDCPALPAHAQLPLVLVNGEVVINGGKISIPRLRKKLQALGLEIQTQKTA